MNENRARNRALALVLAALALALLVALVMQVAPQLLLWMPFVLVGGAAAQYALWRDLR